MANSKKIVQAAAGAGDDALNVEDVFSTYLYTGNDTSTAIDNEVDLAGEGGLVWVKARSTTVEHVLYDTERGALKLLQSQSTAAELTQSTGLSSFNSNGFTVGTNGNINGSPHTYASWTFRKAPKFFDVQTFTATSSDNVISHNLSSEVGTIFLKPTSGTGNWWVYHRSLGTGNNSMLQLNTTSAQLGYRVDTPNNHFSSVSSSSVTLTALTGTVEYVMYLFAHNDGDGEFGPDGDADIIKCGTFTTSSSAEFDVDLGFEPSFVLTKRTDSTGNWDMFDTMRGFPNTTNGAKVLRANLTNSEGTLGSVGVTSTGFKTYDTLTYPPNATYIYIAIRRGPMAVPESATDVFDIDTRNSTGTGVEPGYRSSSGIVDFALRKNAASVDDWQNMARLIQGQFLKPNTTAVEAANSEALFDYMNGYKATVGTNASLYSWMWKRAPQFCDVVTYKGNNTQGRSITHNLGVAPEMIWVKARDFTRSWNVYHKDLTPSGGVAPFMEINSTDAVNHSDSRYPSDPTDTTFVVGNSEEVNSGNYNYIAYLFASLDGISKCGSYTGNGTNQNIECGFSSGARFVIVKAASTTGQWAVWDTERGIVAGDDSTLYLDSNVAADTDLDFIDPYSGGFNITNNLGNYNASGVTYIFYAIA